MPIVVRINPVRIEEVEIDANSPVWEDVLLSVWPIVRAHLKRLDRDLTKNAHNFLRKANDEVNAAEPGTLLTGQPIKTFF